MCQGGWHADTVAKGPAIGEENSCAKAKALNIKPTSLRSNPNSAACSGKKGAKNAYDAQDSDTETHAHIANTILSQPNGSCSRDIAADHQCNCH